MTNQGAYLVTQQQLLARANVVDKHIPAAFWPTVSALVSWSAFNAGMATTGVGLVGQLATTAGWGDLQRVLGLDSYDATEAGALSLTAAAVTTSIDLAAAAALRLAGAPPKPSGWEFSMNDLTKKKHRLPTALDGWARGVRSSPDWQLLKKCRDQVVHRAGPRRVVYGVVYGSSGAVELPSSEVRIDGKDHPIDALVQTFSAFGEATFEKFCDAVLADFPPAGKVAG